MIAADELFFESELSLVHYKVLNVYSLTGIVRCLSRGPKILAAQKISAALENVACQRWSPCHALYFTEVYTGLELSTISITVLFN